MERDANEIPQSQNYSTILRDEVDLDRARLWVRRLKGGLSVEQPIAGDELRAFRRYLASREDTLPWLFLSEHGPPYRLGLGWHVFIQPTQFIDGRL